MILPFTRDRRVPVTAEPAEGAARLIPLRPGEGTATVRGQVVRGGRDLFAVLARAGQVLSVALDAPEDNAALEVFAPGTSIRPGTDGHDLVGPALTDALAGDQRAWEGRAPATGPYLIAVGPIRGNAAYRLSLRVA